MIFFACMQNKKLIQIKISSKTLLEGPLTTLEIWELSTRWIKMCNKSIEIFIGPPGIGIGHSEIGGGAEVSIVHMYHGPDHLSIYN